jgi:hypothetical protein
MVKTNGVLTVIGGKRESLNYDNVITKNHLMPMLEIYTSSTSVTYIYPLKFTIKVR